MPCPDLPSCRTPSLPRRKQSKLFFVFFFAPPPRRLVLCFCSLAPRLWWWKIIRLCPTSNPSFLATLARAWDWNGSWRGCCFFLKKRGGPLVLVEIRRQVLRAWKRRRTVTPSEEGFVGPTRTSGVEFFMCIPLQAASCLAGGGSQLRQFCSVRRDATCCVGERRDFGIASLSLY